MNNYLQDFKSMIYYLSFPVAEHLNPYLNRNLKLRADYIEKWSSINDGHSLGVEWELFIEDEQGAMVDNREVLESLVESVEELRASDLYKIEVDLSGPSVEYVSSPHFNLDTLEDELIDFYENLEKAVEAEGYSVSEKAVYKRKFLNIFHRDVTAGMHVHLGAKDREEAVKIMNAIRRHLPDIVAFTANSYDSGVADKRLSLGIYGSAIPEIADIDNMYEFARGLWGETRAYCISKYHTVEVRVADSQKNIEDILTAAAYIWGISEAAKKGNELYYLVDDQDVLEKNFDKAVGMGRNSYFETVDGLKDANTVILDTYGVIKPVLEERKLPDNIMMLLEERIYNNGSYMQNCCGYDGF